MQHDWDSLFFNYTPHNDHMNHEERLLRDVGLTRTLTGELAWAEDPSHLVTPPPRASVLRHGLRALVALWMPRGKILFHDMRTASRGK